MTKNIKSNSDLNDSVNLIKHFCQNDHTLRKNFRFLIFKTDIIDLFDRLNLENQLIHLFLKLNIQILNVKILDLYLYKKTSVSFKLIVLIY